MIEHQDVRAKLAQLREEHGDLDVALAALMDRAALDQLQLARIKRRKLALKDQIAILEASLIPDIIA